MIGLEEHRNKEERREEKERRVKWIVSKKGRRTRLKNGIQKEVEKIYIITRMKERNGKQRENNNTNQACRSNETISAVTFEFQTCSFSTFLILQAFMTPD